ncbi:hypothetical protein [Aquimarina algiphila]|uniref:Uncharacterized protein n=1 Tax=Aquimarina algiphila TaxID=2047982 RepID=A0A554VK37_9FLAO|nr:hypothetical protein [Aquimarina algiphila]TSE08325.1 hypothetical protein FOF46_13085 [Aquimarina algiphila]
MRPKGRKKIELWLIENKHILNITGLEKVCEIQKGRIQKFITHGGKLNDKEVQAIELRIKCLC